MRCGCVALMGLNHVLRRFFCLVCGICQSTCIVRFVSANKVSSHFQMHPAQAAESAAVLSLWSPTARRCFSASLVHWPCECYSAAQHISNFLELLSVVQPDASADEVLGRSICNHLSRGIVHGKQCLSASFACHAGPQAQPRQQPLHARCLRPEVWQCWIRFMGHRASSLCRCSSAWFCFGVPSRV